MQTTEPAILSVHDALAKVQSLPVPSTLLLLGATDTGKTTWTGEAVRTLTAQGQTVAVVDGDLGQSEIGPPGTVGAALAAPETSNTRRSLRDLTPIASYFVGALTPACHTLPWAVAVAQITRAAIAHHPDVLIVDTCGWVRGGAAVAAKRALVDLLAPRAIFAFARADELDPLLREFAHVTLPLYRVTPDPAATRKSPAARATRRAARFLRALQNARETVLHWDRIALRGTALGLGEPVAYHLRQFVAETLRCPVLYAELSASAGLLVVVHGEKWLSDSLAILERHFHASHIQVVPAQRYAGLLLGLIDNESNMLDIGLLSRLDFDAHTVTVLTPCRRPAAICQIQFGTIRLRPDGQSRGELRPGDV